VRAELRVQHDINVLTNAVIHIDLDHFLLLGSLPLRLLLGQLAVLGLTLTTPIEPSGNSLRARFCKRTVSACSGGRTISFMVHVVCSPAFEYVYPL
jgi:hypothetical protein